MEEEGGGVQPAPVRGLSGDLGTAASKLSTATPVSTAETSTSAGPASVTTAAPIVSSHWTSGSSFTPTPSHTTLAYTSTSSTASTASTTSTTIN